jgi:kynurenine formamidase
VGAASSKEVAPEIEERIETTRNRNEVHMSKRLALAISICLTIVLSSAAWSQDSVRLTHLVDLTHTLSGRFPIVPVPGLTFPFDQKPIASLAKNGVFAEEWHMIAHNGTHIDAPNHYIEGGRSMAEYDIHELIVPAVVIDIRKKAQNNPDAQLTLEDVQIWEKQHGPIPKHVAVFMYSGWDKKATADPKAFVGLDNTGKTHFPTLSSEAVEFLLKEREIVGVGVDTLSVDQVESTQKAAAHKAVLGANKWIIECANNLGSIPATGATILRAHKRLRAPPRRRLD